MSFILNVILDIETQTNGNYLPHLEIGNKMMYQKKKNICALKIKLYEISSNYALTLSMNNLTRNSTSNSVECDDDSRDLFIST